MSQQTRGTALSRDRLLQLIATQIARLQNKIAWSDFAINQALTLRLWVKEQRNPNPNPTPTGEQADVDFFCNLGNTGNQSCDLQTLAYLIPDVDGVNIDSAATPIVINDRVPFNRNRYPPENYFQDGTASGNLATLQRFYQTDTLQGARNTRRNADQRTKRVDLLRSIDIYWTTLQDEKFHAQRELAEAQGVYNIVAQQPGVVDSATFDCRIGNTGTANCSDVLARIIDDMTDLSRLAVFHEPTPQNADHFILQLITDNQGQNIIGTVEQTRERGVEQRSFAQPIPIATRTGTAAATEQLTGQEVKEAPTTPAANIPGPRAPPRRPRPGRGPPPPAPQPTEIPPEEQKYERFPSQPTPTPTASTIIIPTELPGTPNQPSVAILNQPGTPPATTPAEIQPLITTQAQVEAEQIPFGGPAEQPVQEAVAAIAAVPSNPVANITATRGEQQEAAAAEEQAAAEFGSYLFTACRLPRRVADIIQAGQAVQDFLDNNNDPNVWTTKVSPALERIRELKEDYNNNWQNVSGQRVYGCPEEKDIVDYFVATVENPNVATVENPNVREVSLHDIVNRINVWAEEHNISPISTGTAAARAREAAASVADLAEQLRQQGIGPEQCNPVLLDYTTNLLQTLRDYLNNVKSAAAQDALLQAWAGFDQIVDAYREYLASGNFNCPQELNLLLALQTANVNGVQWTSPEGRELAQTLITILNNLLAEQAPQVAPVEPIPQAPPIIPSAASQAGAGAASTAALTFQEQLLAAAAGLATPVEQPAEEVASANNPTDLASIMRRRREAVAGAEAAGLVRQGASSIESSEPFE